MSWTKLEASKIIIFEFCSITEEIPEILNRHYTLKQANKDLLGHSENVGDSRFRKLLLIFIRYVHYS